MRPANCIVSNCSLMRTSDFLALARWPHSFDGITDISSLCSDVAWGKKSYFKEVWLVSCHVCEFIVNWSIIRISIYDTYIYIYIYQYRSSPAHSFLCFGGTCHYSCYRQQETRISSPNISTLRQLKRIPDCSNATMLVSILLSVGFIDTLKACAHGRMTF